MLKQRLENLKRQVEEAAKKINRSGSDIRIVCAVKYASLDELIEVVKLGFYEIGENRVQEAVKKINFLKNHDETEFKNVKWHMIGHLQTNKAAKAVEIFDLIQSVDSLKLAKILNSQAIKNNKILEILLQVNISREVSKFGIKPESGLELLKEFQDLTNLKLKGIMGVAPFTDDPEKTRPYFRQLKDFFDIIDGFIAEGMPAEFEGHFIKPLPTHESRRFIMFGKAGEFVISPEKFREHGGASRFRFFGPEFREIRKGFGTDRRATIPQITLSADFLNDMFFPFCGSWNQINDLSLAHFG